MLNLWVALILAFSLAACGIRTTSPGSPAGPREETLPLGNAEPYNGPRLEGESIPTLTDTKLDFGKLANAILICTEEVNFAFLAQYLGDHLSDLDVKTSLTPKPVPHHPGESLLEASARFTFPHPSGGTPYRLTAWGSVAHTLGSPLPKRHPYRFLVAPEGRKTVNGNFDWLELPYGLPAIGFRLEKTEELASGRGMETLPVSDLAIETQDEHGPTVPLKTVGAISRSQLTVNTDAYAQCIQVESQGIGTEDPSTPDRRPLEGIRARVADFADFLIPFLRLGPIPDAEQPYLQRTGYHLRRWAATRGVAVNIYQKYVSGQWGPEDAKRWLEWCEATERSSHPYRHDCRQLTRQVSHFFYEHSLDELGKLQELPPVARLRAKLGSKWQYARFHLNLGLRDAGYHRGAAFVTMNLNLVKPEDWNLVFFHEMLHSVDPLLLEAVKEYPELAAHGMSEAALMQGLHRGLLAEWRAWVITLETYRRGRARGLFNPPSPLLEGLLPYGKARNMSLDALKRYVFTRLDKSFVDPKTGPFADLETQARLARVREKLRSGELSLDLGPLGALLEDCSKASVQGGSPAPSL